MSDRIQALMEELGSFDVRKRLTEIQVATLVVGGRQDEFIPLEHSQLIADGLPNAQLVVLEHSGHTVAEADVEQYQRAVQAFMVERVRA
jgi:pimeloyl-ACP methyl ester carboxylesterase